MTVTLRVRSLMWFATGVVLTLVCTLLVSQAWRADALPGDTDSTFVPVTPCRLFDYRPAPNQVGPRTAPLGPGEVFTQQVTGGAGNCSNNLEIPTGAVAVAMNVTAVGPTAQTNIRVFPADLTEVPTVSNLNVSAGQAPFPNKVDVKLSPNGAIKIFNAAGSVSVLADVVGYYTDTTLKQTVSDIETSSRSAISVSGWTKVVEEYGIVSDQRGVVMATFQIDQPDDNDRVECGFGRATDSSPFTSARWTWESPDQGDFTPITITLPFNGLSSIGLFCRNIEPGSATIRNTYMTVLATAGS